jgi:hypothetical protein
MTTFTKRALIIEYRSAVVGVIVILFLFTGTTFLRAQQSSQEDVKQLVRSTIDNELNSGHQDDGRWTYRLERREGSKASVRQVVETKDLDVQWLISFNGDALTPEQHQKENDRLEKLINDPDEQRKKKREQADDDRKAVDMFKMLPEAFLYRCNSHRGSLTELIFSPNPNFRPPSREAQVFHGMEGTMWIDAEKKRLVEIDGHLAQDIEFLGGIVGHLDKGGRFMVKRAEVAPGQWVMTQLTVEVKGKALLFKSINLQQTDAMSDFRRIPADLSLVQAADMLKNSGFAQVAGGLSTSDGSPATIR